MQSHGREVDEEGWNSSGGDSEGVQRSAHSTPQAGQLSKLRRPFGEAAQRHTNIAEEQEELQVTSRSRSAFIPRRLKQVPTQFPNSGHSKLPWSLYSDSLDMSAQWCCMHSYQQKTGQCQHRVYAVSA